MDEKQKLILEMSQKLFDEKGLHSTSIGDIVRECKISKSTFYKYFSTKENLIYELMFRLNSEFLEITNDINLDESITEIEKFHKKVVLVWKYIFSQCIFNAYIAENFPNNQGEDIIKLRKKARTDVENEYYNSLIKIYGDKIKPIIWDMIFYLDSLIHEFVYIIRMKKKDISPNFISEFIIDTLDEIIKNKEKAFFTKESIFYIQDEKIKTSDKDETIKNELLEIKNKIEKSNINNKSKALEALDYITKELSEKRYDSLMLDAMFSYLEKETILKQDVKRLIYIIK